MKSRKIEITMPTILDQRAAKRREYTGESFAEYVRSLIKADVEAWEVRQAEMGLVEQAVLNGMSA